MLCSLHLSVPLWNMYKRRFVIRYSGVVDYGLWARKPILSKRAESNSLSSKAP